MTTAPSRRPTPHLVVAPQPRRVADVVIDTLRDLNVRTFYGVPGGAITPIYDALIDAPDLRLINNRHESAAMFIAAGAALNGQLSAVLVTSGPGVTNVITGLANAFADSIPVVVLGGEVAHRNFGRGALQEGTKFSLDLIGMVRSVTKYAATITNPRSASSVVRRAVQTALSGRQGPVFLSLPVDIMMEKVTPTVISAQVSTSFQIDEALIERAAGALQSSKRGLIMMGSGARHPLAVTQVRILAEHLQIPVCTTPKGKGLFPERNPLSLGVLGYGGHPSASNYVEGGIDVLLAVGCGLGETATNSWAGALQPTSTFIQIDIDGSQIGKNYQVDVGLVGAAHQVLPSLIARVRPEPLSTTRERIEVHNPEVLSSDKTPLHPARVMALLQETFPVDTIYTSDIGEHLMFATHYLRIDHPDGFVAHHGLGSMGSGIGAAIGAKHAKPHRPVVAICGDYGFQMFGMELATCVQYKIGVAFAILNDSRMRMVENGFEKLYGRHLPCDSPLIDFAALGRAVGADGVVLESAADFARLKAMDRDPHKPLVMDIRTDPSAFFAVSGRVKHLSNFEGRKE